MARLIDKIINESNNKNTNLMKIVTFKLNNDDFNTLNSISKKYKISRQELIYKSLVDSGILDKKYVDKE